MTARQNMRTFCVVAALAACVMLAHAAPVNGNRRGLQEQWLAPRAPRWAKHTPEYYKGDASHEGRYDYAEEDPNSEQQYKLGGVVEGPGSYHSEDAPAAPPHTPSEHEAYEGGPGVEGPGPSYHSEHSSEEHSKQRDDGGPGPSYHSKDSSEEHSQQRDPGPSYHSKDSEEQYEQRDDAGPGPYDHGEEQHYEQSSDSGPGYHHSEQHYELVEVKAFTMQMTGSTRDDVTNITTSAFRCSEVEDEPEFCLHPYHEPRPYDEHRQEEKRSEFFKDMMDKASAATCTWWGVGLGGACPTGSDSTCFPASINCTFTHASKECGCPFESTAFFTAKGYVIVKAGKSCEQEYDPITGRVSGRRRLASASVSDGRPYGHPEVNTTTYSVSATIFRGHINTLKTVEGLKRVKGNVEFVPQLTRPQERRTIRTLPPPPKQQAPKQQAPKQQAPSQIPKQQPPKQQTPKQKAPSQMPNQIPSQIPKQQAPKQQVPKQGGQQQAKKHDVPAGFAVTNHVPEEHYYHTEHPEPYYPAERPEQYYPGEDPQYYHGTGSDRKDPNSYSYSSEDSDSYGSEGSDSYSSEGSDSYGSEGPDADDSSGFVDVPGVYDVELEFFKGGSLKVVLVEDDSY